MVIKLTAILGHIYTPSLQAGRQVIPLKLRNHLHHSLQTQYAAVLCTVHDVHVNPLSGDQAAVGLHRVAHLAVYNTGVLESVAAAG